MQQQRVPEELTPDEEVVVGDPILDGERPEFVENREWDHVERYTVEWGTYRFRAVTLAVAEWVAGRWRVRVRWLADHWVADNRQPRRLTLAGWIPTRRVAGCLTVADNRQPRQHDLARIRWLAQPVTE